MIINKIHIENFTVFKDTEIQLTEGINVFIGQNGTGKTHLLKLIYGVKPVRKGKFANEDIGSRLFRSDVDKLINNENSYVSTGWETDSSGKSYKSISSVEIEFKNSALEMLEYSINLDDDSDIDDYYEAFRYMGEFPDSMPDYTFIPAKEILSHSKGLLALNNRFDIPFDETYIDIITSAELPEAKKLSQSSLKILNVISEIIGGDVVNEDGSFYIDKKFKKIEFSLEAEGLRKFGLLWKLIKNGLIEKGSVFIWDEPDANINPELLPTLAKILLAMEKEGVQIFIATHSYNLAKYLELFREDNNSVSFYNLYKENEDIHIDHKEYFGKLKNNSIIDSDFDLYEDVIESIEDDSWRNL